MYHFREYQGFFPSTIEAQILGNIYNELSQKFAVQMLEHFDFDLKFFGIFSHISIIKPFWSLAISSEKENFQLVAINIQYNFIGGKKGDTLINENQLWGFKKLKKDYGNLYIREEKLIDKVIELFHSLEIDFPQDTEFSKRFYVCSDNENKTRLALDQNTRTLFCEIPNRENFIFEIQQNHLVMGNRKPINEQNAMQIAQFLNTTI